MVNQKINVSLVMVSIKHGFDLVWEELPENDNDEVPGNDWNYFPGVHALSYFYNKPLTVWYVWDTFHPLHGFVKDEFPMITLQPYEPEDA